MTGGEITNTYNKGVLKIGDEIVGKAHDNILSGGIVGWLRTTIEQERKLSQNYYTSNTNIQGIGCETSQSIVDNSKEDEAGVTEKIENNFNSLQGFINHYKIPTTD